MQIAKQKATSTADLAPARRGGTNTQGLQTAYAALAPLPATVEQIDFHGDRMVASVLTTHPMQGGRAVAYRQLRFYTHGIGEWIETTPPVSYWGSGQIHREAHLTFHYRQRDTALIVAVAPEIDALYSQLRHELRLPEPQKKLIIDVNPAAPDKQITMARFRNGHLSISPPVLAAIPVDIAPEQMLTYWLLSPLVHQVLLDADRHYQQDPDRYYVQPVLHDWLIRRHNPLPTAWHGKVIPWRLSSNARDESKAFIIRKLCQDDRVVETLPISTFGSMSLHLCYVHSAAGTSATVQLNSSIDIQDLSLPPLLVVNPGLEPYERAWTRLDHELMIAMLDFAVDRYGTEILPVLIDGFNRYSSLELLIPTVFNLSPREFEEAWRQYLRIQKEPSVRAPLGAS